MRIYGPNRTGVVGSAPAPRRAASGAFSLAEEGEATSRPANAGSAPTVGGIDALLALQGVEDLTQRRKRAVSRGSRALDALEDIRLKVLSGTLDQSSLMRLKAAVGGLTEACGDPRLDAVLGAIELRVEVELAKAGLR
ncbi:MAG: flagellar assembly protein FliX [Xanthobacteraceae bacterium]